jgi:asparaginyl-tRNA synthetase
VGEIIGGSQREERLQVLEERMQELSLCGDDYGWYLDLRKYGGTKHAGFWLGFERLIMYMTGCRISGT